MPYRRLPNTDTARIRAMKIAMQKGQDLPPHKLAFSSKTVVRLQKLLPHFENNIQFYRHSVNVQTTKSKDYNEILRKARIYLTHFLRVMNMAIYRGDLPSETRTYYGMAANESTVPSLNSENELVSWGKRIIEGEEFRIRKGGNPITNPTIAVVKVRYENFVQALFLHNNQAKKNFEFLEKNAALRREADEIILQMWNEVEKSHIDLPEETRKIRNEEYGLVYFYRKNEPEKIKTEDIEDKVTSLSNNF
ncbi:MAG: hypothetical protein A2X05_10815 [Bacteroidetes bacterium GWE2_41_25]|nr:MAG: hypothetical protein A2X03_15100 [Bacteroidetes bacterium GWA2_40_15]OFX91161.1 MAG: hypothetical protein A2X05_10815 [Bacteroidetes bacterium GWE2_41_25]OFX96667.1 MAG: hypothetical protein A2X06_18000 [Bacteroidetes bacterium GWC2_40_22]OFY60975.1 MAG: hypothetical protein A2X04_02270 [Bacteroidetes bacterium GWF2_41_9]HAM09741.1 hypothetical protein [Bacteroidales bacterium]